jgi:Mg-chelatase subunit ChlD
LIDASKGKYQLVGTNETLETIQPDEPTPTSIITLTPSPTVPTSTATPLPSPIESNIVLVIDASGSTGLGDPTRTSLIDANALYIVQNITGDTNVGVVAFGGAIAKTGLLSMSSEANKAELDALIRQITPSGGENPTDIDNGLREAEKLLDGVNGTKEIIVLSDGLISSDGLAQIKNTVLDLKNKDYTMHFVQVLLSKEAKIPNNNYNELAIASDTQLVLLNPDERMVFVNGSVYWR